MEQTAVDAYGFQSYTPAYPGGLAVANATAVPDMGIPHEVLPKLGFGTQNPFFWVLILFLIITGYISLGFNFGLKKVLKGGLKVG
jgi:hypothetical protein